MPAMIITYAQGMALLAAASEKYEYRLDLEAVARIWRGGCIIRAALLEDIRAAFRASRTCRICCSIRTCRRRSWLIRKTCARSSCLRPRSGLPAPGLMVSLGYLDGYRSAWLPANLIQAQRDYFGAHTYERIDAKGTFHTEWEKELNDRTRRIIEPTMLRDFGGAGDLTWRKLVPALFDLSAGSQPARAIRDHRGGPRRTQR